MDLIINYGSDSESNEEGNTTEENNSHETENNESTTDAPAKATSSYFFNTDEISSSSDDSDGEQPYKRRSNISSVTQLREDFKSEIFDNTYSREERMKMNKLSKHVNLSEKAEEDKNKKKHVCKQFLKGKCRFGKSCRYSHPVADKDSEDTDNATITSEASIYKKPKSSKIFDSENFKSS